MDFSDFDAWYEKESFGRNSVSTINAEQCSVFKLRHLSTLRVTPGHFRWKQSTLQRFSTSSSIDSNKNAEVVICGGGIAGTSLAYHLAKRGLTDVMLLDQGSLTCGTTWHSVGLVGLIKGNAAEGELARYSANLYESLEEETGLSTGYKRCGAIYLATTEDRLIQLKRLATRARSDGFECHLLSPGELQEIVPWITVDGVIGGIYSPKDGVTDPTNTTMSLARGAKMKGVQFMEKTQVSRVLTDNGRVTGVETEDGQVIKCQYFVNAAGLWSRHVGQKSKPPVTVPLQANHHQYAVFKPKTGVNFNTPYVRDWDNRIYMREWSEGLLLGGFALKGKPMFLDGKPPASEFLTMQEEWDIFDDLMEGFIRRVPHAKDLELRQLFNGPESFTPDMLSIVGEVPEIRNYFVMTGLHSMGITMSGGLGKYLADWIVDGKPLEHLSLIDVKRFAPHHNKLKYLQDRASESEGRTYTLSPSDRENETGRRSYILSPPILEYETGRKLCCTALYGTLDRCGAVFGESMGMEYPLLFDKKDNNQSSTEGSVWKKPMWFDTVLNEYHTCRNNVGIVDLSSMAVFELQSDRREHLDSFLQRLCASNLSSANQGSMLCASNLSSAGQGSFMHTWLLNDDGHIVSDCMVACTHDERYIVMTSAKQWTTTKSWISKNLPQDQSVRLKDLTPGSEGYKKGCYGILGVIGPKADKVFKKLTDGRRLNNDEVGCYQYESNGHIITTSLGGTIGFLLLLPHQIAEVEYHRLMCGCGFNLDFKIRNVGHYALRWLQAENGIPTYGTDYGVNNSPGDVTLKTHQVEYTQDVEFIGQQALLAATKSREGSHQQLIHLALDDHNIDTDIWPWGSEPIHLNGKVIGKTTSASYSPASQRLLCWGQVASDGLMDLERGGLEVDIAGKKFKALLQNGSDLSTIKIAATTSL